MEKSAQRLHILLQKYLEQSGTEKENEELWEYILDPVYASEIKDRLPEAYDPQIAGKGLNRADEQMVLSRVFKAGQKQKSVLQLWSKISIAAALIFAVLGIGMYYFTFGPSNKTMNDTDNDILPGKNLATLTLSGGRKIVLSDAVSGEVAREAGVSISKTADGQLVYQIKDSRTEASSLNTLSTAKGETYVIVLPDNSKVWLNAASSLRYPTSFASSKNREVLLTGEGYFEIAKDAAHPFIVSTGKQRVKVLGTHFNINSYEDAASTKTTLLEGSVLISALTGAKQSETLKPNQQAVLTSNGIEVKNVDAAYSIAWKKGFFMFNNEDLESIMKKIALWYNVEVEYTDKTLMRETFLGTVSKYENVSKVLNALEETGIVQFQVSGKKIIISRK